ncbi:SusE domain-containing protein [Yeosuana sp.]|uniref:SusE domain-containing protein n=1 Tax=Yeosuana sp. TaxID=2529388 RepID=UPI004055308B
MKKLYKNILFLVFASVALTACETESNLQPEGLWDLSNPTIISPSEAFINLDETTPNEVITFNWNAAQSSAGYIVTYKVVIDTLGTTAFDTPVFELVSGNGGKDLSASVSYETLDEALSFAGYPANSDAQLSWAVIASSINKQSNDRNDITLNRFENEIIPNRLFLSGTAAENNNNLSEAIILRRLNDSDGNPSNIHEVYTSLTAGNSFKLYSEQSLPAHIYGGTNDGEIVKSGSAISVTEDGQYRIRVDLDNNTYSMLKIERWNVKGSPIIGGWDSDEPLEYIGGGVWQASMDLVNTGGFLFRADVNGAGYWDYLFKRVAGTANSLIIESDAASQGLSFEDIPSEETGTMIVTLNLSSNAYTYSIVKDPNAIGPIETPSSLFLFVNNTMVEEMTKDGDVFKNSVYLALQSGDQVSVNTLADGTGDSYTMATSIGATDSPNDIKVTVNSDLSEGTGAIPVERDQAYSFSIDFANAKFQWNYYNLFLFHWDEINQKWDDRDEYLLTYVHPYKFTGTVALKANFDMKFFSPWDNDFGGDNPSSLSGGMTNKGGSNIRNIVTDGNYLVNVEIANNYATGTYEFVKQ